MKNILKVGMVVGTLLMLTALVFTSNVSACWQTTDLFAGQDFENPAGIVTASIEGDILRVVYDTKETDWTITNTHLWVGDDLDDLPRNKKGNLQVGHFPYDPKSDECIVNGINYVLYNVPIPEDTNEDGMIYIVAHAVVGYWDGCEWKEETAWGDTNENGIPNQIPGVNNWALYFPFYL